MAKGLCFLCDQPYERGNKCNTSKFPNQNLQKPTRFILAAERVKKMAKGLCFLCDQPYERGHKCCSSGKQLFLVEVLGEEDEEEAVGGEAFEGKWSLMQRGCYLSCPSML